MMSKMRVMGWSSAGSKKPPRVFEVDVPVPGPNQVKVKVSWTAVNRRGRVVDRRVGGTGYRGGDRDHAWRLL